MSSGQASTPPRDRFRLGDIWITPGANEIGGARVEAKAIEVLVALADAAPDVLSAAALLDRVWPNVVVVDNVVHQAIAQLRKALGDDARAPRYIESVPRRGLQRDNQDENACCLTGRCSRTGVSLPQVNVPLHPHGIFSCRHRRWAAQRNRWVFRRFVLDAA